MGHDLDQRRDQAAPDSGGAGGAAPGKRALTDRLVRRAQRKNPELQHKLKFAPTAFSSAPVDSAEFAQDVAAKQASIGLKVDGVVGPTTKRAVIGDPFDFLDAAKGGKGTKGGKGAKGGGHGAAGPGKRRALTTDIVDRRDEDGGTRVAANFGQDDGITADSSFVLCYPDGRHVGEGELTLVEILPHHTWLRTRKTTFQTGLLVEASIPPEPEAPEEGPMLHGDGSIGDDDASRLEA